MAYGIGRASVGYYVAFVLLVVALVVGAALFWLLVTRNAGNGARFVVSAAQAQDCAVGDHAPACYHFDVSNLGPAQGIARCDVLSGEGTVAVFLDNKHETTTEIAAGETRSFVVKVSGDTITAPSLQCEPA
jgi:hypothetical protein